MIRRCGSSNPTPTPPNGLAMKPGKTRRKVIEGNADTVIRQTTRRNLPRTASVAGGRDKKGAMARQPPSKPSRVPSVWRGGETKNGELKENTGANTRETNIKTLPQAPSWRGGETKRRKPIRNGKVAQPTVPRRGGECLLIAENALQNENKTCITKKRRQKNIQSCATV